MPLDRRTDFGDARFAGVEAAFSGDVGAALEATTRDGFDFVALPLVNPRYRRPGAGGPLGAPGLPASRADVLLASSEISGQVVGVTSADLWPGPRPGVARQQSEAALEAELGWAVFLSLQAVIVPLPPPDSTASFARVLHKVTLGLTSMALWVRLPLTEAAAEGLAQANGDAAAQAHDRGPGASGPHLDSSQPRSTPWERWHQVRSLCEHSARLGVVLDIPPVLAPGGDPLGPWRGEPLRAVVLPTGAFLVNKRGYPCLPKAHQALLLQCWRLGVQVVLSGPALVQPPGGPAGDFPPLGAAPAAPPTPAAFQAAGPGEVEAVGGKGSPGGPPAGPLRLYSEYLAYLFRKPPEPSPEEQLEQSYRDYLQAPLQPLQDNLESQTYETFERDATKYTQYQTAVRAALAAGTAGAADSDRHAVIMVVGSGRGPLVRASLAAAQQAQRRVRVYAVEKNPNAVVTLHNMVATEGWEDRVTVVFADMRHWQAPEQADILVSELLGSFGDNELSPECLDGALRHLAPQGVSIPCGYTSYLQPITSAKLWGDVKAYGDLEHLETPYVVKLHRFNPLGEPQRVFTFRHASPGPRGAASPPDNSRAISLRFPRPGAGAALCHGFAGFFEATLYGDVTLSTLPSTHTPHMFSWFPIYFPLKEPALLPPGAPLEAHMWRACSAQKVWYEWAVTSPVLSHIHNPGGRSYSVGL